MHNHDPRHFSPRQTCVYRGRAHPPMSDAAFARRLAEERNEKKKLFQPTQTEPSATAPCTTTFGLRAEVSGVTMASRSLARLPVATLTLYS